MKFLSQYLVNLSMSEKKITGLGILVISLFVFIQYFLNADNINRDGILYIFQAHAISEGNLNLATEMYPNIIFPQGIAWLHHFFNISYATAAHAIGFLFFLISSYFFLKTLMLISKDSRILYCGIVVILTSLAMDKYVVMILRDHALWAGLMMAIYSYLKFIQCRKWVYLILTIVAISMSALFRVEILSLIPIILTFSIFLVHLKRITLLTILLMIAGVSYFVLIGEILFPFARLDQIWNQSIQALLHINLPLPITSKDYWLAELIKDYPLLLKGSFFLGLIIYKWVNAVGFIFLILLWFGIPFLKARMPEPICYFLFSVAAITFIWPVINLFSVYVFTSRYLVPHLWILMIFVTLGLYQVFFVWDQGQIKLKKFLQFFVLMGLLIKFIDVMVDKHQSSIDKTVAHWAQENKIVKEETYVQNLRIRYYMNWLSIPTQSLPIAIKDESNHLFILEHMMSNRDVESFDMIKSFPESKESKIYIYQRR